MNLLFKRSQRPASLFSLIPLRIGSGVMFHLRAELELDEEEEALVKHYRFTKSPIVLSDPIEDMKNALRPAVILSVPALPIWFYLLTWGYALTFALLLFVTLTAMYFRELREQIMVSDLLDGGRTFRCGSVVDLINKEAYLEGVCEYLRQLLVSAKHWNDREVIPIKPLDKAAAKSLVLTASRGN